MDRWIVRVVAAMVVVAVVSGADAQTLTEPNGRAKTVAPPATAKALPPGRVKSCALYGDGFAYVPGTDSCIKIGGYVTIEGSQRH